MRGGLYYAAYADFNPRSRKESDKSARRLPEQGLHFNPRSRKESDQR